jgi:heme exporter protein C
MPLFLRHLLSCSGTLGMSNSSVKMAKVLKVGLLVWMSVVIWAAFIYAPPAQMFRVESLARIMFFHVPCAMTATVMSVASALFALFFIISKDLASDIKSKTAAELATVFWVLTTITGAIFAKVQWGMYWNWDPKQSAIVLLILIYLAYFALRAAIPDQRKQATVAAGYTLFAAVTMPFLTYVLPNSTPSLHPKGVIFTSDGMDSTYKIIFWSSTFGFLALTYWIYKVQTSFEALTLRIGAG